ncbi:MAG: hypothetical protein PHP42_03695 [Bacteroidota bacterium]|nr:hypothetical protein [Bacteroidota bacterium]
MKQNILPFFIPMLFWSATSLAQVDPQIQIYRNEPRGNYQFRREGIMDGNQIRTLYYNNGEVGQWPFQPSGEWPKGSGHSYLDGVTVLIGGKVMLKNAKTITPIEASYREEMDRDPSTGTIWGLEPVPGYSNSSSSKPAQNRDPNSFPLHWPRSLFYGKTESDASKWDGYWYGYFGRGVTNADFETFFVMDDSQDKEFTRPPYSYWPIGDTLHYTSSAGIDSAVFNADSTRGGLGVRVEVRGFQWSHVLAEDIIFWHYDIVNISDHDYQSAAFGFYTDPGVGGTNNQTNSALFSRKINLAYAWNPTGLGQPGNYKTGYFGYAYLESPGIADDKIDNDFDGITDEKRDSGPGTKISGKANVISYLNTNYNMTEFMSFYGYKTVDDIPAVQQGYMWTGDENANWRGYSDLNHNGKWDPDEPLNDDVGADGVGPFDPQYNGPDEGEGDGIPTAGEPNFDATDKDESDQIGLTAVSVTELVAGSSAAPWPKNDDAVWSKMTDGFKDTTIQNSNIMIVFASAPFPLKKNKRERFSMALAMGTDLDNLIFNKITVQAIYNANYNFSQPPYTPHVTAVQGNKKVYLYWDNIAEQSYDRFLHKYDFEGYSVYRSTEPEFKDVQLITDSKGEAKYWKPLVRYDVADSIMGPDPVGINGARFYRGDDTGLQHSFVDSTVENGMRYFYAVVSYDKGDPAYGTGGLQPTECSKIISMDVAGNIRFVDINCAVATPNAAAAGYVPPQVSGNIDRVTIGAGTGAMKVSVLNPSAIAEGNEYRIKFFASGTIPNYTTASYNIYRVTTTATDTLYKNISAKEFGESRPSPAFDGMVITFTNDTIVAPIDSLTTWIKGNSTITMAVGPDDSNPGKNVRWPDDYKIVFGEKDTTAFDLPPTYPLLPVNFKIYSLSTGKSLKFIVEDKDGSGSFSVGDVIKILDGYVDDTNFKMSWKIAYGKMSDATAVLPAVGDRFEIHTKKPFQTGDYFSFKAKAQRMDNTLAKNNLSKIHVVPNPYIGTAKWEPRTLFQSGRGERRISFVNLPQKCTVRIYTVAGALVKTLTKDSAPGDGALTWNLVSEDGMDIAYGLYVYHVDAPGIGEYINKFAVIK